MGYSYYFRLAIDNFDQLDHDLKLTIRQAYRELVNRPMFPVLGTTMVSHPLGYGTGPIDRDGYNYPLSELAILTSQFPSITFSLFFCYFDETILTAYQVQNTRLIASSTINGDDCKLGPISFGFSIADLMIEHDATEYLNQ